MENPARIHGVDFAVTVGIGCGCVFKRTHPGGGLQYPAGVDRIDFAVGVYIAERCIRDGYMVFITYTLKWSVVKTI